MNGLDLVSRCVVLACLFGLIGCVSWFKAVRLARCCSKAPESSHSAEIQTRWELHMIASTAIRLEYDLAEHLTAYARERPRCGSECCS